MAQVGTPIIQLYAHVGTLASGGTAAIFAGYLDTALHGALRFKRALFSASAAHTAAAASADGTTYAIKYGTTTLITYLNSVASADTTKQSFGDLVAGRSTIPSTTHALTLAAAGTRIATSGDIWLDVANLDADGSGTTGAHVILEFEPVA